MLALATFLAMLAPAAHAIQATSCTGWVCATAVANVDGQVNSFAPDTETYACAYNGQGQGIGRGEAWGLSSMGIDGCGTSCTWTGQGGCGDEGTFVDFYTNCGGSLTQEATATQTSLLARVKATESNGCGGGSTGSAECFHQGDVEVETSCSAHDAEYSPDIIDQGSNEPLVGWGPAELLRLRPESPVAEME